MAGRGMGCATRGGGAVMSGSGNHMVSTPNTKNSGPVEMNKGGMANAGNINEHKRMAMGKSIGAKKMKKGGAC